MNILHIMYISKEYIQSIICITHKNQIFSDIKYSGQVVNSTGMDIRNHLKYWGFLL